jgi:transcription elongation factor Elf1
MKRFTFIEYMDFSNSVKKEIVKISVGEYSPKLCPFCNSEELVIRTSRKRSISELGNISKERHIELQVATFKCENCGRKYKPQHPNYPKGYTYSRNVIQTALSLHFKKNLSGNKIAAQLAEYYNVKVPPKTIHSWINALTEDFMKNEFKEEPIKALEAYKSLTIDGTGFNLGTDVIGKKNDVRSSSVVKLSDKIYLLTWWE